MARRLLVITSLMTVPAAAQRPPVEPDGPVRQLHGSMIKPASDIVFNVAREAPRTHEQWTGISRAAAVLVASGNLLMLASPRENRATWIALCQQLIAAGRTARRQAEARNLAALMRTSDRLVIVCETCHAPYRNRNGGP